MIHLNDPTSYHEVNAADLFDGLVEHGQPLMTAQNENGDAKATIGNVASSGEAQDTLALLRILALGSQEAAAGKVKPVADVVERLRAKRTGK